MSSWCMGVSCVAGMVMLPQHDTGRRGADPAQGSTAPMFNPFWDRSEVMVNPGLQKKERRS